jgi:hypothetical protein
MRERERAGMKFEVGVGGWMDEGVLSSLQNFGEIFMEAIIDIVFDIFKA